MMKNCPFCSHDQSRVDERVVSEGRPAEHKECAVMCLNCGAFGPNALGYYSAEKMWNMRRELDDLASVISELLRSAKGE